MGFAWLVAMGCSGAETAAPAASARATLTGLLASVNAPCPGLGERASSAQLPREDLFVEAVILDVSSAAARQASLATLRELPQTDDVRLIGTPHVLGPFDYPTEMTLGPSGGDDEPTLARLSVLPRHADNAAVLELQLDLELPRTRLGTVPARRTVAFMATARDNEPALARLVWDEASQRSLLVLLRTFEVRSEDDLRAIFQCKMHQREQALSRVGTEPAR